MQPAGNDVLDTWPVGLFGPHCRAHGSATRPLWPVARERVVAAAGPPPSRRL